MQGRNLVEAAKTANVVQFVHSSVSGAGDYHRSAPGWTEGRWDSHYWESKAYTEDLVRNGISVLDESACFLHGKLYPSGVSFANWVEDRFLTIIQPGTALSLVAVGDMVGLYINDPETFNKVELELTSDL